MRTLALLGVVAVSACGSVSIPVTGASNDGKAWTGYFTTKEFVLSDGTVNCSGIPPMGAAKQQEASFTCDDGRTGVAITNRTHLTGGTVDATFSDGSTGKFSYGS